MSLSLPAAAQAKAVMEGVAASRWTVKVDTTNTRVEIATTSYGRGGNAIANVGLFTTSNVVVGAGNAVVLYATGSIKATSVVVGDSYFAGSAFFNNTTNIGQVLVASGVFNQGTLMDLNFTALVSSGVYRLSYGLVKDGTPGEIIMKFSGNALNEYNSSAYSASVIGGVLSADAGPGKNECFLGRGGVNYAANGTGSGTMTLFVNPNDDTRITAIGTLIQQTAVNDWAIITTGCHFDGLAAITRVAFVGSAGNLGGYMNLVKLQ